LVIPFSYIDLLALSEFVAASWERGLGRDWSARAGTLEWSCTRTAEHAYDAVLAVGFFLASRRQDRYPEMGGVINTGKTPWPSQLIEAMSIAGRMVAGVVATAPEDARAIIWRRPEPTVAPPSEFAPRAALEMILHGHDVAAGLGVKYEPPEGLVIRLRDHTRGWPHWSAPGWHTVGRTGDPWLDLLEASGRARFAAY
jgi:hypothetical protein